VLVGWCQQYVRATLLIHFTHYIRSRSVESDSRTGAPHDTTPSSGMQSCTRCGVGRCGQPHRAFVISGTPEQRERTRIIITAAVVQYEKLFSGTLRTPPRAASY
jgi:hypothetical protein